MSHAFWASIGWHAGTWAFRLFGVAAIGTTAFLGCRAGVRSVCRRVFKRSGGGR